MANSTDQLRSLVEGLYLATVRGSMRWIAVQNSNSFLTSLNHGRLELAEDENEKGEPLFIVNIYNSDGALVDSFNDEIMRGLRPSTLSESNYFDAMRNMFSLAKRSATGADKIIKGIIDEIGAPTIDSDDDVPF